MPKPIGNPLSWSVGAVSATGRHLGGVADHIATGDDVAPPQVRRLELDDLRDALRAGMDDFAACRSDVVFLCLLYPLIGGLLAWAALTGNLLPLIFPILSGFALVGPIAAVGLYEMSRKRESGGTANWGDAFAVLSAPSFGAIFVLSLMLFATYVVWLIVAHGIWSATLGPVPPASISAFAGEVFGTARGWAMITIGMAVGFFFAVIVLAASVVSFPMLLDRKVGLPMAVATSIRVALENPVPIAAWGLIVAGGLVLGAIPALLGLIVVLPILGHATWHLYRRAVG